MVRAAALILLLGGCSQPMPAEEATDDSVYAEVAAGIAAQATPAPDVTPATDFDELIPIIANQPRPAAREQSSTQRLIEDMERRELEQRVRRLEDEKLNGGY